MTQKPKILIVDDKPQNLFALEKLLKKLEVEVIQATSGFDALGLALEHDFCMGIIDIQMPEMDGYELVELLRSNEGTTTLPIIFVSAIFSDEYHHRKGYDAGAVDFLSKPFNPDILLSKVRIFLDLYNQRINLQELVQQLNEANNQLTKLNADKDKFFSIVAHDLKGPFLPLLGIAELLSKTSITATPKDVQEMSQKIFYSAKNIFNLLENLLQWSRLQRGRLEYSPLKLDLKQIAAQNVRLLAANAADKGVILQSKVSEGMAVYADEHMLDTVIRNLIANALKFTPKGGQVIIRAKVEEKISPTPPLNFVEVSVSDTGVGMAALTKLLPVFPKEYPLPIIVVQHLHPSQGDFMPKYFDKKCALTVKEADEKEPIKPGYIYFAPPNYHLLVEDDETFSLSADAKVNFSRPSVDVLFESAVDAYKSGLIGIVLTGANDDGANGLRLIKKQGGLTIVQDPETAEVPLMPQSAMKATKVDYVLSLEEMGNLLVELGK